jgi:hypothetical protein
MYSFTKVIILSIFSVWVLTSCGNKTIKNKTSKNYWYMTSFHSQLSYYFFPETTYDKDEEMGLFEIKVGQNLLEKGKFENGLKVGNWLYSPQDKPDSSYVISWLPFNYNECEGVVFNDMYFVENSDNLLYGVNKDTSDSIQKIFSIAKIKYEKDKFDFQKHKSDDIKYGIPKHKGVNKFTISDLVIDGKKHVYSNFERNNGIKNHSCRLIFFASDAIYVFGFTSSGIPSATSEFLFFELIRNFKINNKKLFPYIIKSLSFENIQNYTVISN